MKTQNWMFSEAHRKVADANDAFLFLVEQGLTREDLQKNIERRPALWRRFENWLNVLPTEE